MDNGHLHFAFVSFQVYGLDGFWMADAFLGHILYISMLDTR